MSERVLIAVIDALAALGVPFMLSGSLASNFYGVPRATQDADLVVEFTRLEPEVLAIRLGPGFEIDLQLAFETVTGSRRLAIHAKELPFDVELFGLTDDPHDQERFARRRFVDLLERHVAVPTAEDVVINKLRWWKLAKRHKDLDDARNVVAIQRSMLDRQYVQRWCATLNLLDEWTSIDKPFTL